MIGWYMGFLIWGKPNERWTQEFSVLSLRLFHKPKVVTKKKYFRKVHGTCWMACGLRGNDLSKIKGLKAPCFGFSTSSAILYTIRTEVTILLATWHPAPALVCNDVRGLCLQKQRQNLTTERAQIQVINNPNLNNNSSPLGPNASHYLPNHRT